MSSDTTSPLPILARLACPVCCAELRQSQAGGADLACRSCGREFPWRDGVGYLVVVDEQALPTVQQVLRTWDFYRKVAAGQIEYDRWEGKLEESKFGQQLWRKGTLRMLNELPPGEGQWVLEVGAGAGEVAYTLAQRGYQVVATDYNSIDLQNPRFFCLGPDLECAHAEEFFQARYGLPENPPPFWRVVGEGERLPFANRSFDIVVVRATLHHFAALGPVIAEIHRVLKPGGTFLVIGEPFRSALELSGQTYVEETLDFQEGIREQYPTISNYFWQLRRHGFRRMRFYPEYWDWPLAWRKSFLGRWLPPGGLLSGARVLRRWDLLRLLPRVGGISWVATAMPGKPSSPVPSRHAEPLCPADYLADLGAHEAALRRIIRQHTDTAYWKSRLVLAEEKLGEQLLGWRQHEECEGHHVRFSHRQAWIRFPTLLGKGRSHSSTPPGKGGSPSSTPLSKGGSRGDRVSELVIVAIVPPAAAQLPQHVTATINGSPAGEIVLDQPGERQLHFPLPSTAEPVIEVSLEVSPWWRPGGADARELGVAVEAAWVQ